MLEAVSFLGGRIREVNLLFGGSFLFKILGSGIMFTCSTS